MKIFEFAVIYNPAPTKDENDRGETPKSKLVVPVTSILANNEAEARIMASRAIPEDLVGKLEQLEIAVRPF